MLNNLDSRGIKTKVRDFLMIRTESIMYMSSIAFREKTIFFSSFTRKYQNFYYRVILLLYTEW